ncbi:MAG: IPTL-CTERM sorting domain-containing protein [Thermoanaerobaculia bacterium]|nr:IPTL-CTERM sorting domain-containing protein [Thermoanaerobaculia bacterium]
MALLLLGLGVPAGAQDPVLLNCPVANCTANDLVTSISLMAVAPDPTCDDTNDTFTVQIVHDLDSQGGSTKYDIGIYVANDADESACWTDILGAEDSGWSDLGEMDACKDVGGTDMVTHTEVYTVPCLDEDSDGEIDPIVVYQSWSNNDDQVEMCTVNNVIEGTAAKCRMTVTPETMVSVPYCGDGEVDEEQGEECDDGNDNNADECDNNCMIVDIAECGDGELDDGEECDDGGQVDGDGGCQANCQLPICGDDILDDYDPYNEECDDGGNLDGDGCRNDCTIEMCGDDILDPQEQCDDGNLVNGDGCDDNCDLEEPPGEEPVPTLGEWGLILFGLLLAAMGALLVRRRPLFE